MKMFLDLEKRCHMQMTVRLFAQFISLLANPLIWVLPMAVLSFGYHGVLKKTGLRTKLTWIPVIAEHRLSKILFANTRAFWHAVIFALVFLAGTVYLDTFSLPSFNIGYIYYIFGLAAYGFYMIRVYWRLCKSFNKGILFRLGTLLFPPLFVTILGWGKTKFDHGPVFRRSFIPGRLFTFLREAFMTLLLLGEIAAVAFVVGLLNFNILKPRLLVYFMQMEIHDAVKDVTDTGEVVAREDLLNQETIASMPVSREKYYPDHTGDEKVVVMEYIIGSNLENGMGLASVNINQMKDATAKGDGVTFVLEAGGSLRWFTPGINDKTLGRYTVENGKLQKVLDRPANQTMSSKEELLDFITWTKENYPADRYMLVFWNHGGGLSLGYGQDYYNPGRENDMGVIFVDSLAEAVRESGVKFDLIGFDACLMQDIEIAYILEPYADYYLASEEVEDGIGWNYTYGFGELAKNPALSTEEFGKAMIASYDPYNMALSSDHKANPMLTLSLVDLTMAKPLYDRLTELYRAQKDAVLEDPRNFAEISIAASNAYTFNNSEQIDMIDYLLLLQSLDYDYSIFSEEDYQNLIEQTEAAVLYQNGNAAEQIHGIALTFPYADYTNYHYIYDQYKAFGMDDAEELYSDFFSIITAANQKEETSESISIFAKKTDYTTQEWYRSGFEDYAGESLPGRDIPLVQTEGGWLPKLTEATWNTIADEKQIAFMDTPDGLKYLGTDYTGNLDENAHLLVTESDTWITVNGHPVCYEASKPRSVAAGTLYSGTTKALLNGKREVVVFIEWAAVRPDFEGNVTGRVLGYHYADDENAYTAKGLEKFGTGDSLQFIFSWYDEQGNLLKTEPEKDAVFVIKGTGLTVAETVLEPCTLKKGIVLQDVFQRILLSELKDYSVGEE